MSNTPKLGSEAKPMLVRHGKRGHVSLSTSVTPVLKDHLIEYCEHADVTLKAAIETALRQFLYEVRP